MKKTKIFFLASLLLVIHGSLSAQSVDQIISKHLQAVGGVDKLHQIKSMYTEGILQLMGAEAPNITYVLNGRGYRNETDFNGQKIIRVLTDKGGWQINPMAGASTPQALSDDEFKMNKDQLIVGDPLLGYKEKGLKAELLGKESGAYKVKLSGADNQETTFFIDSASYQISKTVAIGSFQGQQVQVSSLLTDYQKTDLGYMVPRNVSIDMGGFSFVLIIKKVELNKEIDPSLFEMPK